MPSKAALAAVVVLAAFVAVLVPGSSTRVMAQFSGTPKEQAACRADVAKFCKGLTGDSDDVFVECLVKNAPQVSSRCREVLEAHGKLPPR
jgi:hypothetical protein